MSIAHRRIRRLELFLILVFCQLSGGMSVVCAAEATVAVASNFRVAAGELERRFVAATNHRVLLVAGSTGKLYSQIVHGAPYDVLLAADRARPARLEREGRAVTGTRFTYATGRLVLWAADDTAAKRSDAKRLSAGDFDRLAIANPALAPYGIAARQALTVLGLWDGLQDKIVMGENIGQAHALVATGNADLGLLALASFSDPRERQRAAFGLVPAELHEPIEQQAVLLLHGESNDAARAFLAYLRSDTAAAVIRSLGYEVD